ncbi:MAG: hypothetical protein WCT49_03875 [Candidatus Paceibacterota bacterium]|jgi:Tfp pilus assembly protein PilO|nr:hypothetical protein [Candidatus Paceibacterota bacterium]
MKNILAVLLIIASIGIFYMLLRPVYGEIQLTREEKKEYERALNDSRAVEERQSVLGSKFNEMPPSDVERLEKMVPDSIDNIRLIIEVDKIAQRYNMSLEDPKVFQQKEEMTSLQEAVVASSGMAALYGVGKLSFTVTGTYEAYIAFIKDVEKSLRLIDIISISLTPSASEGAGTVYDFNTEIKTYWLK